MMNLEKPILLKSKISRIPLGFSNFPMGRSKKAAMELSVTAIVVLILAIVMLGLGLGFIKGMFGKVSVNLEEQIATEPEPPTPSGAEPITLSRETIVTHAKEPEVLKVGVYNPTGNTWTSSRYMVNVSCSIGSSQINPQLNMRNINQSESKIFSVLFTIPSNADPGVYLCQSFIRDKGVDPAIDLYTKDFTIKVIK